MAHYAMLDDENKVVRVSKVANAEITDEDGREHEWRGVHLLKRLYGSDTRWVKTSYNGNFRKNYAAKGDTYDEVRDAFISPRPFDSWVLNEDTCRWEAPSPAPTDGKRYAWDEGTLSWQEI